MGKRSTVKGYWREHGGTATSSGSASGPTPRVMTTQARMDVADVSAASAATGVIVPAGARVLRATVVGVNGDASTVDIGDGTTADRFFNELDSNAIGASLSADVGVLTADTELYAGTGITAGTGAAVILIEVVMDDDGVVNN